MKIKNLITIIVLSFVSIILYGQISIDSLEAYYPFDGNAMDESGNSYNGIVNGATLTTDRFGNENSAFQFDGIDDYILLPSDFDLKNRTICVWFSADNIDYYNRIYSSDHPNLYYGQTKIMVHDLEGVEKLQISKWISEEYFEANISENSWYFICVAIADTTLRYYINGLLVDRITNQYISSSIGDYQAYLGTSRTATNRFFSGKIDDVRIYGKKLTQCEILALYTEGFCNNIYYDTISVTDTLIIDVMLSNFDASENLNTLKVYPNPTRDIVIIDNGDFNLMQGYKIKIYDIQSQLIFESLVNQQKFEVNIASFGSYGLYFINVYDDHQKLIVTKKILLE